MKITRLAIQNYRTLEDVELAFPAPYSAICGPNDSGKTNIVRAIRALMKEESPFQLVSFDDEEEFTLKEDFPKWKDTPPSERHIKLRLTLDVERDRDAGFYQFLIKQLSLTAEAAVLTLTVQVGYGPERSEPEVLVECNDTLYEGIVAQEVLKRLQSSRRISKLVSILTDLVRRIREGCEERGN